MTVQLDIGSVDKHLSPEDIREIRTVFERSVQRVRPYLPIDDVWVEASIRPGGVPQFFGLCAWTLGRHLVTIELDPQYPRWRDAEGQERFSSVMAHEFYHVMRWRGPDYQNNRTLRQKLVSEGLALNFEEETGHPTFPERARVSVEELRDLATRAVPLLDKCEDSQGQFRTDAAKPFLGWEVYVLGWAIAKTFLHAQGMTPSSALHVPAEQIVEWWLKSDFLRDPMPRPKHSVPMDSRPAGFEL
jgi:hypothetical protein